jgi:predicted kinase
MERSASVLCAPVEQTPRRAEQLPRRNRLDRRLAKGRLRPRHVRAVARALVARREWSEPGHGDAEAGTPAALARRVADLTAKLESQRDAVRAALGVLLAYQRKFLEDGEEILAARRAERRIAALHGALSCETVWVEGAARVYFGAPIPLAEGDVAADVAQLALDLRRRGEPRLAETLAAGYALGADDYGLYGVLGFYERDAACHFALAAAAGAEEEADPAAIAAAALASPSAPPLLVATAGGIASGKTTVAKALTRRLAAPRVVAERLVGTGSPARGLLHELLFEPEAMERLYVEIARRAEAVLASGRSVVLDACFAAPAQRAAAAALAARCGARFLLVHCDAPEPAVGARLHARDVRDASSVLGWHALAAKFASRWFPPGAGEPALRVDTTLPREVWEALLPAALLP